jgi:hypothetical protein
LRALIASSPFARFETGLSVRPSLARAGWSRHGRDMFRTVPGYLAMKRSDMVAAVCAVAAAAACGSTVSTSSNDALDGGGAGGSESGGSSGIGGTGGFGGKGGIGGTGAVGGVGGNGGSGGTTSSCGNFICEPSEYCATCPTDCPCGTGGGAGAADAGGCIDPDGMNPNVAATTSGLNGNYRDQCDATGNLVEYVCETTWQENCFPNPDPSCRQETGRVVPIAIDCAGRCQNGACSGRCPDYGDTLTYLEFDPSTGSAVLRNEVDGARYSCSLIFDSSSDPYNCKTNPVVGATTTIESLGLTSEFCLGTEVGNIGTAQAGVQQCTYSCTLIL